MSHEAVTFEQGTSGSQTNMSHEAVTFEQGTSGSQTNVSHEAVTFEEGTAGVQDLPTHQKALHKGVQDLPTHQKALHKSSLHHWDTCTHNPGHEQFIPVNSFTLNHLPGVSKAQEVFDHIQLLVDLTVRLVVRCRSKDRPTDPFYGSGGSIWTGTGTVVSVQESKSYNNLHCVKVVEDNSYVITIRTACHVVFDSFEASQCSVEFFYDSEDDKHKVKRICGTSMGNQNIEEDLCDFECVTSDKDLVKSLETTLKSLSHSNPLISNAMAVIVSHPHGLSKHISIGQWNPLPSCEKFQYITKGKDLARLLDSILKLLSLSNPLIFDAMSVIVSHPQSPSKHFSIGQLYYPPSCEDDSLTFNKDGIMLNIFPFKSILVNKVTAGSNPPFCEPVGIECDIHYPDGERSKCHIWQIDLLVKHTKEALISEGGIHIPADQLCLELDLGNGVLQVMKDDQLLEYYWDDLTITRTIIMRRIQ